MIHNSQFYININQGLLFAYILICENEKKRERKKEGKNVKVKHCQGAHYEICA